MALAHAHLVRLPVSTLLLLLSGLPAFAAADLRVSKTGPVSVKPGEQITYVIEVSNIGPDDAAGTMVFDPNPTGLVFLPPITGDCTGTFPCSLGTVPAGQTRIVTGKFLVPSNYAGPDLIQNTASATTTSPEPVLDNNSSTAATAVLRIAGFNPLPPCRIVDTRDAAGPYGGPALPAGAARTFNVRSKCGIPDNASSVSLNLTVTGPTGAGDLRLFAGGTNPPLASAINYGADQTRANNGIVPLSTTGTLGVLSDQATGQTHLILDVNGYFSVTNEVPTPASVSGGVVKVRPAPEVELTFDNVTAPGVTTASVIEFVDNRTQDVPQDLRDFFPADSPYRALLPSVIIPNYVKPLGKGGPGGIPTFVLSIVDTTAAFSRTAEFHGLEDFRLGWHPPCVVLADPTQEPRTFYARELPKNEPSLVEENQFAGSPVFVDISSGCGSNKGSGWNFSLYLTARDTRTPAQIADFMLLRLQDAITSLGAFIDSGVASQLQAQATAAAGTLVSSPVDSLANMNNFLGIVDAPANAGLFDNATRNVRGEMAGRAQAARYMIRKLLPPTGTIVEFTLPNTGSRPWGIASGPDGNLWFAENNGNRIGRITTAGVITEFAIPTASALPGGITAGPDGNVWFTELLGNKIGRITPAGAITEFVIPTASSRAIGITAGPDGNLWFTEEIGNKIGRITPAGVITEFAIPTATSSAEYIALGPDGNLWFPEYSANKIGRITPLGVITEFALPAGGGPSGIASGPDGNLWFPEVNASRIGRITPAGVITEFALPTPGSQPRDQIASGPDGNLWFTEYAGNRIGQITPAGVITEFAIPSPDSQPIGIAAGADGNLWFTEQSGNKIGRISP
jgi:uncharacterized repeat protein (TIGR01451 family)